MTSRLKIMALALLLSNIGNIAFADLDTHLKSNNVNITEGYVTNSQKFGFIQDAKRAKNINSILEIGFNAGHSADFFLTHTDCKKLVSFDIGIHDYVKVGVEYVQNTYGSRFSYIEGDSKVTLPQYEASNPGEKFDLIFIDGGHTFDCIFNDLLNCRHFADEDTIVIIDDYVADVKAAVDLWVQNGQMVLLDLKASEEVYIPGNNGGYRIWVVAKYVF